MNFDRDFKPFCDLLDGIWALKGQALPGAGRTAFFRALESYPLREVQAGLDAHLGDPKRGQFLPMPADVIAQIQGFVADDGRPGPEEAWAICFRAADENATVVWTDEMAEAYGACWPILRAGDEVAARMAFKEVYARLLAQARERRMPPRWSATLGHDKAAQDAALLPHVQAGRLPGSVLNGAPALGLDQFLALPAPEGATPENLAAREKAKAELANLKAAILARPQALSAAAAARAHDVERTERLKDEMARKVSTYAAEHGQSLQSAMRTEIQHSDEQREDSYDH